jgi:hypothetical protein
MVEGSILAVAIYFINNSKGLAPSPVYMECTWSGSLLTPCKYMESTRSDNHCLLYEQCPWPPCAVPLQSL